MSLISSMNELLEVDVAVEQIWKDIQNLEKELKYTSLYIRKKIKEILPHITFTEQQFAWITKRVESLLSNTQKNHLSN